MRTKRRKKRKNFVLSKHTIIIISALIIIIPSFTYAGISMYKFAFNKAKEYISSTKNTVRPDTAEIVHITIPSGASTKDIAEILYQNGLISNKLIFRLQSKSQGYDGTYIQGEYDIVMGTGEEEIMNIIHIGPQPSGDTEKVTIPEGFTAKKIAQLLDEKGLVKYEDFIKEMNTGNFEYDFLEGIPKREYYLEGYLFPATYDIPKNTSAYHIISIMLDRFDIAYSNILKYSSSEYSSDELVIIASMIEAEIQLDDERAIAAGVIYNRLKDGMKLQIDSTVQYANNTRNEIVTYDELEVDSPYNTYINEGLPIGPICNPGEAALEAAVNPDDNDYIFYVVKERGKGEHVFTNNYDDFLAAKEAYKNSFNN